jgi:tetratricopeptide (TPR) repeat protein
MWSKAHDHAVAAGLRSVQCNPSDSFAHIIYGNVLDVAGRPEEGLVELQAGIRLNPLNPMMHQSMTWLAGAYLNARRYSEALEWLESALLRDSAYPLTHLFRAVTLAHLGDAKEAAKALADCELAGPRFVERFVAWRAYQRAEDNQHMLSGLRKAGWDL